jgi:hypothetical protein
MATNIQETELTQEEKFQQLMKFIECNREKKGFLIPVLHKARKFLVICQLSS